MGTHCLRDPSLVWPWASRKCPKLPLATAASEQLYKVSSGSKARLGSQFWAPKLDNPVPLQLPGEHPPPQRPCPGPDAASRGGSSTTSTLLLLTSPDGPHDAPERSSLLGCTKAVEKSQNNHPRDKKKTQNPQHMHRNSQPKTN